MKPQIFDSKTIESIEYIINKYKPGDELECRKGTFYNHFSATISRSKFFKVISILKKIKCKSYSIIPYIIQYYNSKIKKVIDTNGNSKIIKKCKKHIVDLTHINVRISLSREIELKTINKPMLYQISRVRHIFTHKDYKIDLSQDKINSCKYIYRFEIECITPPTLHTMKSIIEYMII